MANPIWKDYYVSLGSADPIEYRILCNDEVIYSGKAWKRPGHPTNEIRINDICADYLKNVLPSLVEEFTPAGHPTFVVETFSGSAWSQVASVQFYNDWSYDYDFNPATMGLSFPINRKVDSRQWIVHSAYNASSIRADITLKDGTSFFIIIPVEISPSFNADFNSDFAKEVRSAQTGTAVFNLSEYGNIKSVKIDKVTYEMVEGCNRYALYYVNAHGGWDSLLIEGNHSEVDNLTRHNREVEYDNRSIQNRGRQNYVNEISKTLTLHTSWMSDEESSRMHHLLNSTEVYLYDINKDEMIPVVLKNGTTEYKTYRSNGHKLFNYTIEVSYANYRIRR